MSPWRPEVSWRLLHVSTQEGYGNEKDRAEVRSIAVVEWMGLGARSVLPHMEPTTESCCHGSVCSLCGHS